MSSFRSLPFWGYNFVEKLVL